MLSLGLGALLCSGSPPFCKRQNSRSVTDQESLYTKCRTVSSLGSANCAAATSVRVAQNGKQPPLDCDAHELAQPWRKGSAWEGLRWHGNHSEVNQSQVLFSDLAANCQIDDLTKGARGAILLID